MTEVKNDIELRSEPVQEIISSVPNWMISWGNTVLLVLIIVALLFTWFIKYPDVLDGKATIGTEIPTVQLHSKSSGQITHLLQEGELVKKGDIIAVVESDLTPKAKKRLEIIVSTIRSQLNSDIQQIKFAKDEQLFGSLQQDYENLQKSVLDYQTFLASNKRQFEIDILRQQIRNQKSLKLVTDQQYQSRNQILAQTREQFNSLKRLNEKNVISQSELFKERNNLAQVEEGVLDARKSSVQSSISITDLTKQLELLKTEVDSESKQLVNAIIRNLQTIENALRSWSGSQEITAHMDGTLAYLENLTEYQFIENGKALFAIVPDNNQYVGSLTVSNAGSGKIKKGQQIRISMAKYPSHQFGHLTGTVVSVSLLPSENSYRVDFVLNQRLISTYNQRFEYTPGMTGTAEIITDDLSLAERIFNKFNSMVN